MNSPGKEENTVKKLISILLTLVMVLTATCTLVLADDAVKVNVTIADGSGKIVVAHKSVEVTDTDGDGALTISDALYAAHEKFYADGAEGYGTFMSDYGLSLGKLWGEENGGSYGYYVNNASAWSLADPVSAGDCVYAFVYTDLVGWSDTYSWFDKDSVKADAGEEITLVLKAAGFDENWAPVETLVEGAQILVDGKETGIFTDENGEAVVTVDTEGKAVISASSDTMTLVPPICIAKIGASDVTAAELPKTGVADTWTFLFAGAALVGAGAVLTLIAKKKEQMA